MNSDQLSYALDKAAVVHTNCNLIASRDTLSRISLSHGYPFCIIVNTSPSNKSGSHWCAYYFESPYHIEFFDSFGKCPSAYGFNINAHHWNKIKFQSPKSSVCGAYCLYFIYYSSLGLSMREIQSMFYSNYQFSSQNDDKVIKFAQDIFNVPNHVFRI